MEHRHTLEPFQHSPSSLGDPPLSDSIRSPSARQDKRLQSCRQCNLTATLALLKLENFYEIRSLIGFCEADALIEQHHSSISCEVIEKLGCKFSLSDFICYRSLCANYP